MSSPSAIPSISIRPVSGLMRICTIFNKRPKRGTKRLANYRFSFTVAGAAPELPRVLLLSHRLLDYPFICLTKGHLYCCANHNTKKTLMSKYYATLNHLQVKKERIPAALFFKSSTSLATSWFFIWYQQELNYVNNVYIWKRLYHDFNRAYLLSLIRILSLFK